MISIVKANALQNPWGIRVFANTAATIIMKLMQSMKNVIMDK